MGIQLNKRVEVYKKEITSDLEGFTRKNKVSLGFTRMSREGRHGSQMWANYATFSEATDLFKCRRDPNIEITTSCFLLVDGVEYDILSVENVKGKGLYLEILAKRTEASYG